jgi:hypothetical protein
VRSEITTRDMEGLDGALSYLLKLLAAPANQAALTAQGHTPADTKAFADARQQLSAFNTDQNSDLNTSLELTDENIKAGNALWEYIVDVLGTGSRKRIRKGEDVCRGDVAEADSEGECTGWSGASGGLGSWSGKGTAPLRMHRGRFSYKDGLNYLIKAFNSFFQFTMVLQHFGQPIR